MSSFKITSSSLSVLTKKYHSNRKVWRSSTVFQSFNYRIKRIHVLVCLEGVQNVPVITPHQKAQCYESNKVMTQLIYNPTLSPTRVWLRERESAPWCNCDHTENSKKKMEVTVEHSIVCPGKLSSEEMSTVYFIYMCDLKGKMDI